jgi:ATP-dependent RNA helicase DHX8/PRP22
MRNAACITNGELPDFDEDTGVLHEEDSDDNEDIEIEMVEEEPLFLRGFGRSHQEMEPVKVVKNPDGSLAQVRQASWSCTTYNFLSGGHDARSVVKGAA